MELTVFFTIIVLLGYVWTHPMDEKLLKRFKRHSMSETSDDEGSGQRLPFNTFRPISYDVELQPNFYFRPLANFTFNGRVKIELRCLQGTNIVILHAKKITVETNGVSFEDLETGETLQVLKVEYNITTEFLSVKLSSVVRAGRRYLLDISYHGPLKKDLHGMYISTYEHEGVERFTVITQLEPTNARKMFPCWDEPIFKAVFNITVLRQAPMTSLSNMLLIRTEQRPDKGPGWIADVYESTPPMSTYLVAIGVHDFIHRSTFTKRGTLLRAWAPAHMIDSIDYGLSIVEKSMDFFEDYTGLPYPIAKLDQITVRDFAWGGMENWGLVVYSNDYFMFDPAKHALTVKRDVSLIVNHEIAHQCAPNVDLTRIACRSLNRIPNSWFGNLVTCKWWNQLWLNEGFTSYMENFGMQKLTPELEVGELRYSNRDTVMRLDSLPGAHAVRPIIETRQDIMRAFGLPTYHKGSEVVRMLRETMGEYAFKTAVRNYLLQFKYRNADEGDLFRVFTQTIRAVGDVNGDKDMDIRNFLKSWVEKNNYPVITISRNTNGSVHFKQERFLADKDLHGKEDSSMYQWRIPLFIGSNATGRYRQMRTVWLYEKNGTLPSDQRIGPNDWVLGNAEAHGYYRINYDERNWELLAYQLHHDYQVIPLKNRAQILDDVVELGKAGIVHPVHALRLGRFLRYERKYLPWKVFMKKMEVVRELLAFSPLAIPFQTYMLEIIEPVYHTLRWEQIRVAAGIELIKIDMFKTACQFNLRACTDKATEMFRNRFTTPLPPDFLKLVYCAAISAGGQPVWMEVLEELKNADDYERKTDLVEALACTRDAEIITRFLNMTVALMEGEDSPIGFGQVSQGLVALSHNPSAGHLTLKTVLDHWDMFQDFYLIEDICKHLGTEADVNLLAEFRNELVDDSHDDELEVCTEAMAANYKWSQANMNNIGGWLQSVYA